MSSLAHPVIILVTEVNSSNPFFSCLPSLSFSSLLPLSFPPSVFLPFFLLFFSFFLPFPLPPPLLLLLIGSYTVAQAGLQFLVILLPQDPECWDYSHEPSSFQAALPHVEIAPVIWDLQLLWVIHMLSKVTEDSLINTPHQFCRCVDTGVVKVLKPLNSYLCSHILLHLHRSEVRMLGNCLCLLWGWQAALSQKFHAP